MVAEYIMWLLKGGGQFLFSFLFLFAAIRNRKKAQKQSYKKAKQPPTISVCCEFGKTNVNNSHVVCGQLFSNLRAVLSAVATA